MKDGLRYAALILATGMLLNSGWRIAGFTTSYFFPIKTEIWICIQNSGDELEDCTTYIQGESK